MQTTTFIPGYEHVAAFAPDGEYEPGEEVAYVTLDLGGTEPALLPSSATYRLVGLDTPTPYLQLAGAVFAGRHDALLGTELLFGPPPAEDDQDACRRFVHVGAAEQRIRFSEVRLTEKARRPPPQADDDDDDDADGHTASPAPKQRRSRKGKEKAVEFGDDLGRI